MKFILKISLYILFSTFLFSQNYYVSVLNLSSGKFKEYGNISLKKRKIALSSLYKLFLGYYLLKKGIVDESTKFNCTRSNECKCWDKRGHGVVDIVDAISLSCNRFFCHFRKRINTYDYYNFLRKIFKLNYYVKKEFEKYFLEGNYSEIYAMKPQEIQRCITSFILNKRINSGVSLNLNNKFLNVIKKGMEECFLRGTGKNASKILGARHIILMKTGTFKKRAGNGFLYRNLSFGFYKYKGRYHSIFVFSLSGNSMENSVLILSRFIKDMEDED